MINKADLGVIGLGVMGRNLVLNIAEKGFCVAGYDTDAAKCKQLAEEAQGLAVFGFADLVQYIGALKAPRMILLLVPAGAIVDAVLDALLPHLTKGDLVIDAGNSYFKDTERRTKALAKHQIDFMGVGLSGGEAGARFGPSIMPGGEEKTYTRIQPIFEAIAARVNDRVCVAYLGKSSVGHFVKMVHNGIEYALMQLIAETYDLMKRGLGLNDKELQACYKDWSETDLRSYLLEITSAIFGEQDPNTKTALINAIVPVAKQNGTGMWTSESAMQLQMPTPTIDWAVAMRDLSVLVEARERAAKLYPSPDPKDVFGDEKSFLHQLAKAYGACQWISYAQGFALLKTASDTYGYGLSLAKVAQVWRGGCIIRADLLEDIAAAFEKNSDLTNLLLDEKLAKKLQENIAPLREVVARGATSGLPLPAFMASLSYFDAYRQDWLPANLIQAQRDYFGSHRYERIDMPGTFHTHWDK